ncbi:hypothetical protein J6590_086726 [Homalodisca vitripennis]|nr:hypothetical protein J6590_086726 [Homalodisca vitripennis]
MNCGDKLTLSRPIHQIGTVYCDIRGRRAGARLDTLYRPTVSYIYPGICSKLVGQLTVVTNSPKVAISIDTSVLFTATSGDVGRGLAFIDSLGRPSVPFTQGSALNLSANELMGWYGGLK